MSNVNCVNSKIIKSASKQTINTISLSDDSKTFVIGQDYGKNNDPTLSLFDIENGKCFEVIERSENNTNSVYNVLFDKNNNDVIYYISHKDSEYLYIAYNIKTKEKNIFHRSANKNITLKLCNDNEGHVLITDLTPKLVVFNGINIIDQKEIELASLLKDVTELNKVIMIVSPSGNELLIGNAVKGKVLVYNIDKKEIVSEFSGDFGYLKSLYYDQSGNYLFAIKENNQLIAWNTNNNQIHLAEKSEYINGLLHIFINDKYNLFIVGMITSYIIIFDLNTGKRLFKDDSQDGRVYNVSLSSDGKKLMSVGEGGKVVVRDIEISI